MEIQRLRRTQEGYRIDIFELQLLVFEEYKRNGYAERWSVEYLKDHPKELDLIIDIAEVGLINTEVSELLEDIRSDKKENYGAECADIVIRVMNWCNRKKIDLGWHIREKNRKNLTREKLHGRAV